LRTPGNALPPAEREPACRRDHHSPADSNDVNPSVDHQGRIQSACVFAFDSFDPRVVLTIGRSLF
jgi:hypothetical protein